MPTVKIGDVNPKANCKDPDHNPPTMRLWEPGIYEHTCPSCGKKQRFTILPKDTLEEIKIPTWVKKHNENYCI